MVNLRDLPEEERIHLLSKKLEPFTTAPFAEGPSLRERRVAIVTTAGLHRVDDTQFSMVDLSYRVLSGDIRGEELTMTHSSVHFDRMGFREDVNVVFPIDRLRELVNQGEIGSVARFHYSVMGAGWSPEMIEPTARQLGQLLREDEVNAVVLSPV
ncbi:MAG: selenoprotein B glycine/betaine/sarcosine/D-proline reductase [Deltaproteobacteria bacterium]|nr:selenoprotein B glycine/betaine/sarcosine/D-proline reductase [Deltaproteobacteria bacterium]MBW2085675.1 selenoprotein B glycine/betaine/sarcosine/D-proline reductase [Deltaproteobacteria bacterium]